MLAVFKLASLMAWGADAVSHSTLLATRRRTFDTLPMSKFRKLQESLKNFQQQGDFLFAQCGDEDVNLGDLNEGLQAQVEALFKR